MEIVDVGNVGTAVNFISYIAACQSSQDKS